MENPCTFLLAKKRPENAFLTLIVNYRKILQKTTVNCLFNDMMLFIHWLFLPKNWRFSTNSCKEFIVSLIKI